MVIILTTLISCSTGYNKPADQYYEEGLLFYGQMEDDGSFDILKFRGEAYQKGNDFDHAIKDYSDAIALVPKIISIGKSGF